VPGSPIPAGSPAGHFHRLHVAQIQPQLKGRRNPVLRPRPFDQLDLDQLGQRSKRQFSERGQSPFGWRPPTPVPPWLTAKALRGPGPSPPANGRGVQVRWPGGLRTGWLPESGDEKRAAGFAGVRFAWWRCLAGLTPLPPLDRCRFSLVDWKRGQLPTHPNVFRGDPGGRPPWPANGNRRLLFSLIGSAVTKQ